MLCVVLKSAPYSVIVQFEALLEITIVIVLHFTFTCDSGIQYTWSFSWHFCPTLNLFKHLGSWIYLVTLRIQHVYDLFEWSKLSDCKTKFIDAKPKDHDWSCMYVWNWWRWNPDGFDANYIPSVIVIQCAVSKSLKVKSTPRCFEEVQR